MKEGKKEDVKGERKDCMTEGLCEEKKEGLYEGRKEERTI
jgi:hypothetical protein